MKIKSRDVTELIVIPSLLIGGIVAAPWVLKIIYVIGPKIKAYFDWVLAL